MRSRILAAVLMAILPLQSVAHPQVLPGHATALTETGDIAAKMVDGIHSWLDREVPRAANARYAKWKRDTSSPEAYIASIAANRQHLREMIGLTDKRDTSRFLIEQPVESSTKSKAVSGVRTFMARWSIFNGVDGEGLMLLPAKAPIADVIAIPDADQLPERIDSPSGWAHRLAQAGCRVFVPVMIDRRDDLSGIPGVRMTNQPHREFIQRAAYEVGRTMIGYDVQMVLALADQLRGPGKLSRPLGIAGYGEGGMVALYASATDTRFDVTLVSGYFGPRERLWSEPYYRNVFGLLTEFGDAEIASLIAPRALVIETSEGPRIAGPPAPHDGRSGAASGGIVPMSEADARAEFERAKTLAGPQSSRFVVESHIVAQWPEVSGSLPTFFKQLTSLRAGERMFRTSTLIVPSRGNQIDPRIQRRFEQVLEHTQRLVRESPFQRETFWSKVDSSSVEKWVPSAKPMREIFLTDVLTKLPKPTLPMNPRARMVYDEPKYRGYEVMLDLYEGVPCYGILLMPKDLKPGEKRPVVVCQHGLEGRPVDVASPKVNNPAYNQYACKLAEMGFITFAPQNPYIGEDRFRTALRKAQVLRLTLFGFIVQQHERILDWLETLDNVDPKRMAFYGLSYGGKTAVRIPAVVERYCLSICSADYNEWIWKNTSTRDRYSYLVTNEYDMPEWNLANQFNYAEMSWLIFPRPFMVERGHHDGVAPDEWVAYEYARTRRRYDLLGLGDRTELEVFNGPHTIHGVGTFAFLRKHLKWPSER